VVDFFKDYKGASNAEVFVVNKQLIAVNKTKLVERVLVIHPVNREN